MQSRSNSTSFGRVKNQLFSATPHSLYHTPLFLKHINTLYLITLCPIITITTSKCKPINLFLKNSLLSMKRFIEASTLIYTSIISILLIVISNCSLLNPGPKLTSIHDSGISTFYQSVRGLLTYSSLGNKYPVLNITKVLELQSYIANYRPEIIILNETWLKPAINDAEIIRNDYKIFRLDHCPDSHPPDPNHSNKFKVNSGGILIAVNNYLDMKPKVLKSNSKAEILSITLKLKNNKKICITRYYRVGTLG